MDRHTPATRAPPSWRWKLLIAFSSAVWNMGDAQHECAAGFVSHVSTLRWTTYQKPWLPCRTVPARVLWAGTTTSYRFGDQKDDALMVGTSQYMARICLDFSRTRTDTRYFSQPHMNTWTLNYPPTVTRIESSPEKKSIHQSMTRICLGCWKDSTGTEPGMNTRKRVSSLN